MAPITLGTSSSTTATLGVNSSIVVGGGGPNICTAIDTSSVNGAASVNSTAKSRRSSVTAPFQMALTVSGSDDEPAIRPPSARFPPPR